MDRIRSVKGMNDLFEDALPTFRKIEHAARETFLTFGYGEIRTPILEDLKLFVRGVGETTDIVTKEMFHFVDGSGKGATEVGLRPEGTAAVVRALLQAGRLAPDADARYFYMGPMFRRERPQKGRYRQFHQFGAEAFHLDAPSIDVEQMALIHTLLTMLEIEGVEIIVNTLGDASDRETFSAALRTYYGDHQDLLSDDAKERLEKNPLRLLDSKDPKLVELAKNAPSPIDHIGDAARAHFDGVREGLERLSIPYRVDDKLVRGLDYYTRTVFEAVADTGLGAQNAVAAGGRYDGLVEQLGGKPTSGVGFAAGIERLVLMLEDAGRAEASAGPQILIAGADEAGVAAAERLVFELRKQGVRAEFDHRGGKVKAQVRRADRAQIPFVAIVGEREVDGKTVGVKQMATGDVQEVALTSDAILGALKSKA